MMPIPPEREPIVASEDPTQHHVVTHVWHRFFISVWQFIRQLFPALISSPGIVWDDFRFPASRSAVNPVTSKPAFDIANVSLILEDTEYPMYFVMQLPHKYKPGVNIRPHVHVRPDSTNVFPVSFRIQWKWFDEGEVPPAWSNIYSVYTPPGVAYQADIHGLGNIVPPSTAKESSMVKMILVRDAANATYDTYPSNIYLDEFDVHYPLEKLGTGPEYPD